MVVDSLYLTYLTNGANCRKVWKTPQKHECVLAGSMQIQWSAMICQPIVFHANSHKAQASQQSFEVGIKHTTQLCNLSSFATQIRRLLANQGTFSSRRGLWWRETSAWAFVRAKGSVKVVVSLWCLQTYMSFNKTNGPMSTLGLYSYAILPNMLGLIVIHFENVNSSSVEQVVYWAIAELVAETKMMVASGNSCFTIPGDWCQMWIYICR